MIDYFALDFAKAFALIRELTKVVGLAIGIGKKQEVRRVLRDLRSIYFFPDRTFALLDRMAKGETISLTDLERAEIGFANSEKNVFEAMESLEEFAHKNSTEVSIEALSGMRAIIGGKGGARLGIIEFFMEIEDQIRTGKYDANMGEISVRAETLKAFIVELNARIDDVDQHLLKLDQKD
ncbi:hypothetical protein [Rhodopseudomonas palustris]|uniref:Uncharacterized protein n=1 Tax=Rhodopseudomonas palustris (strain BisB18) TaxID=316056 RepID=Q21D88_RHOPB